MRLFRKRRRLTRWWAGFLRENCKSLPTSTAPTRGSLFGSWWSRQTPRSSRMCSQLNSPCTWCWHSWNSAATWMSLAWEPGYCWSAHRLAKPSHRSRRFVSPECVVGTCREFVWNPTSREVCHRLKPEVIDKWLTLGSAYYLPSLLELISSLYMLSIS